MDVFLPVGIKWELIGHPFESLRVCYVNRLISTGFHVDGFRPFETPVEIQSASFLQTPQSKYTCLGFGGLTQGLAGARGVLVVGSRCVGCLEADFRSIFSMKMDFAGVAAQENMFSATLIEAEGGSH